MIKYAKVNTVTDVVENIFEYDGEELPEEFGNPAHYIKVEAGSEVYINGKYNRENNIFNPPKIYESWILNSNNQWEAPVAPPADFSRELGNYNWNEETQTWEPRA